MKHLPILTVLALALAFTGCAATTGALKSSPNQVAGIYRATPVQIKVADMRASAYYAKIAPAEGAKEKYQGPRYLAVRTLDPSPEQWTQVQADMKKPGSRYGAPTSTPGQVHCVMVWDTQTQQVVGTDCYAVIKLPAAGTTTRFDTYTAEYIGAF